MWHSLDVDRITAVINKFTDSYDASLPKSIRGINDMTVSKNLPLVTALAAVLYAQPLYAQPQVDSLCHPQEGVFFSCVLKDGNIVSLCTSPDRVPVESIAFRFGTREEIKASYFSSAKNNRRFSANVLPANPKASVRQVWFDANGSRYIVTECVGARCHHEGGVIFKQGSGQLHQGMQFQRKESNMVQEHNL